MKQAEDNPWVIDNLVNTGISLVPSVLFDHYTVPMIRKMIEGELHKRKGFKSSRVNFRTGFSLEETKHTYYVTIV